MFNIAAALIAALATVVVHAPKADLTLEVARTETQLEHGLMDRRSLPVHTGMIFVFNRDDTVDFWMKDTLVPLDMVFVGADGTVRRVYDNVPVVSPKLTDDRIPREEARARYVIELPAGEASRDGIAAGTKLDLRALSSP